MSSNKTLHELCDELGVTRRVIQGYEKAGLASATGRNKYIRLNLTIENNSDKDLSFTSGSMGYGCNAINGYMIQGGYMNADVSAGKNTK